VVGLIGNVYLLPFHFFGNRTVLYLQFKDLSEADADLARVKHCLRLDVNCHRVGDQDLVIGVIATRPVPSLYKYTFEALQAG